jgi:hypothetical protein
MSDPSNPYGQPAGFGGQQPYPPQPYQPQPYADPYAPAPAPWRRPGTVTAACVVTIVMSVLALLFCALLVFLGLSGYEPFYDGFRDGSSGAYDDLSDSEIGTILAIIGVVLAVWSAAAILLAVLTMRRSNVSRIVLVVSSAGCILVSLVAALAIFPVLWLIAAIVVIVLLFTGGANAWFSAPRT